MRQRSFFLFLFFFSISILHAQDFSTGNCANSHEKLKSAKENLADSLRLKDMQQSFQDIRALEKLRPAPGQLPRSFIDDCLRRKVEILEAHKEFASGKLKASAAFNLILAQLYAFEQLADMAALYFDRALKADPNNFQVQEEAFLNWLEIWKSKKDGEIYEFKSRSAAFIDPILKNPRASSELKTSALLLRADWLKKYRAFADALEDYKRILKIDPKNLKAAEEVAEDAYRRKDITEARPLYEKLKGQAPTRKNALEKLVVIHESQGTFKEALAAATLLLREKDSSFSFKITYARLLSKLGQYAASAKIALPLATRALQLHPDERESREDLSEVLSGLGTSTADKKIFSPGERLELFRQAMIVSPFRDRYKSRFITEYFKISATQTALAQKYAPEILRTAETLLDQNEWPIDQLEKLLALARQQKDKGLPARFCHEIEQLYTLPSNFPVLAQCLESYRLAGQPRDAKALAEKALLDPKFEASRDRIRRLL